MEYFIVNAFAESYFSGNPAGVCVLENEISEELMQSIAMQNNLAETAFVLRSGNHFILRWFTPEYEIDLCGHATLASAYVLMNYIEKNVDTINFESKSGQLIVSRENDLYTLDFPSRVPKEIHMPIDILEQALGVKVLGTYLSRDLVVLVEDEETVKNLKPNFNLLSQFNDVFAFIVTAKGESCDFVSRFFTPKEEMKEDPVTGSAHCSLIPFWREKLNKNKMVAKQLSKRGGILFCEDCGTRVMISGHAICYSIGKILV